METLLPRISFDLNEIPQDYPQISESIEPPHGNGFVEEDDDACANKKSGNKRKNISEAIKKSLCEILFSKLYQRKFNRRTIVEVASIFDISANSVYKIVSKFKRDGQINCGRMKRGWIRGKKKVCISSEMIKAIPLSNRRNMRGLASQLNISLSSIQRLIKARKIKPHSNAIKPLLKDQNKIERVRYCLSMIEPGSVIVKPCFVNMENVIHIDEKWFMMSNASQKYYLALDEVEPQRSCQSKRFITKVMFLAAAARPRFNEDDNVVFDGKIGIWPFTYEEPAQRKSKNRAAGTMETKAIIAITKEVIRDKLIKYLLPAIKDNWPHNDQCKTIYIQQDNARPHIGANDVEFLIAAQNMGLDIHLICQPPNSPDLNVLDLGFFRAIDSLQHEKAPKNIDELVWAVKGAYASFDIMKMNKVFITLQLCMEEILRSGGGNGYHIPHIGKDKLIRIGMLPKAIEPAPESVKLGVEMINHPFAQLM